MKLIFNRTKIIATLGPASSSRKILLELIKAGVDVFRINFSHGSYEEYAKLIKTIEEINDKYKINTGIMADLQGPKIRIGEIGNGNITLNEGDEITITTAHCVGNKEKIWINYDRFPKDVKKGEIILLDDGKMSLEIINSDKKEKVRTRVIYGGILSSRKGVNLPNTLVSLPCLTDKDLKDLDFAVKNNINWIALSFVRSATDVEQLKKIIIKNKSEAKVIAKIEKPIAVSNIDSIIEVSDAIMVARGDLGVEIPLEEVPSVQKNIVQKCVRASKPVIVATQIMEHMIDHPNPTRAEATDVANVVYEGADALMLSNETSIGKYPVKVVETIEKILDCVEKDESNYLNYEGKNKWGNLPDPHSSTFMSDVICYDACAISVKLNARAIIGMTVSGYTAFKISSFKPRTKIFIFSSNRFLLNTLSLVWGVRAFYYDKEISTDNTFFDVQKILKQKGYLRKGDIVVNTASMPLKARLTTNMLKVSKIK